MKIFTLAPRENWIVDRMVDEWNAGNPDIVASDPFQADLIWCLADWCWRHVPQDVLRHKKVVTTVHHVVPEKFDTAARRDFAERDIFTDLYHVFNRRTFDFVRAHTTKPIQFVPYWANPTFWHRSVETVDSLRNRYDLPPVRFTIMSAQRDTEGHDLTTPKLEKGPDLLVDAIAKFNERANGTIHVLLGGWRRQYVIERLKRLGIAYTYIERPALDVIRDMYQMSSLYLVTARHEGGPQALIECGLMGLPCLSRPVGIAEQVLPPTAISDDVASLNAVPCIPDVTHMMLPRGFDGYRRMFENIL